MRLVVSCPVLAVDMEARNLNAGLSCAEDLTSLGAGELRASGIGTLAVASLDKDVGRQTLCVHILCMSMAFLESLVSSRDVLQLLL